VCWNCNCFSLQIWNPLAQTQCISQTQALKSVQKENQIIGSWSFHTGCRGMIEHTCMHINLTKYQHIAETVTISACRSETRWLKHNLSYTHSKIGSRIHQFQDSNKCLRWLRVLWCAIRSKHLNRVRVQIGNIRYINPKCRLAYLRLGPCGLWARPWLYL